MAEDIDPSWALQLRGIGRAKAGDMAAAVDLLGQAADQWPHDARAHRNLATGLAMAGRTEEAIVSLRRSLRLAPDHAESLHTLPTLLIQAHRPLEALNAIDAALTQAPTEARLLQLRGEVLDMLGHLGMRDRGQALGAMEAALAQGGDEATLRYAIAAMGGGEPPAMTPRKIVVDLFDRYAASFDEHLVGQLAYRTPADIGAALQAVATAGDADVVDLGCGTGLCAESLRPLARSLEGVDLAEKMLDRARERGAYDRLVCADVVEHLQSRAGAFDLAVASDVLIYIGNLAPLFAALHRALRPGGRFAFSVETPADGAGDYTLRPTRRYAHGDAYLKRMAAAHGFEVEHEVRVVLRKEAGLEVGGQVQVWRRRG